MLHAMASNATRLSDLYDTLSAPESDNQWLDDRIIMEAACFIFAGLLLEWG